MNHIKTNNIHRIAQELSASAIAGPYGFFDTEHLNAEKERSVCSGAVTMTGPFLGKTEKSRFRHA